LSFSQDKIGHQAVAYAKLLLPKYQSLGSHKYSNYLTVVQALESRLSTAQKLDSEKILSKLAEKPEKKEFSDIMDDIESITDKPARDSRYLMQFSARLNVKDFLSCREIVSKISEPTVQSQADNILRYNEAIFYLESDELSRMDNVISQMMNGIPKAVSLLALSQKHIKSNQIENSKRYIAQLFSILSEIDDGRVPYILLMAANLQTKVDAESGFYTLAKAIAMFDKPGITKYSKLKWSETIICGKVGRLFSIKAPSLSFDVKSILYPFLKEDIDQTYLYLTSAKDDEIKLELLLVLLEDISRTYKPPKPARQH
jgi:hypothetical protein